jgi:hypothetical protein
MTQNHKHRIGIGFTLALILMLATNVSGQTTTNSEVAPFDFQSSLKGLLAGSIPSLSLASMDSIPIVTVMHEKIDERDQRRHPYGYLNPRFFKEIKAKDIQEVSEKFVLLVVEDQFGQLRAVTCTQQGVPIESILLNDLFYYPNRIAHEVESRRYSPAIPYFYDRIGHEFVFSTIFKIMSPGKNKPLVDLYFHEDETTNICRVAVSAQGRFGDARFEQVNSPEIYCERFALTSPFFNQLSDTLREGVDYQKRGDSLSIYLDRDQSIQLLSNDVLFGAITFRLLDADSGTFSVSQQYKSTFGINGDGDFCDLKSPAYLSDWKLLKTEDDLFDVAKYSQEQQSVMPEISAKNFKKLVKKQCGKYHYQYVKHVRTKEDVASFSSISQIVLKIDYQPYASEEIFTTYVILQLAGSC